MSKETPKDDPRAQTDWKPYKGTDKPWEKPGQASQEPDPEESKHDLEKWHRTQTH